MSAHVANTMPQPGIYRNVPNRVYHSWAAAESQSHLARICESPASYRYHRNLRSDETEAMNLGSAVHALTLRPEDFAAEFVVAPEVNRRSGAGREALAAFQADNLDKVVIDAKSHELASELAATVWANRTAASEIHGATMEASIVWQDAETGILCKARPDAWHAAAGVVVDLKTTNNIAKFWRSALDYGYYFQAAFYREAVAAVTPARLKPDFRFVVIETVPPYPVRVFHISENAQSMADQIVRDALRLLAQCRARNEWPGYEAMAPVVLDPQALKGIDPCLLRP